MKQFDVPQPVVMLPARKGGREAGCSMQAVRQVALVTMPAVSDLDHVERLAHPAIAPSRCCPSSVRTGLGKCTTTRRECATASHEAPEIPPISVFAQVPR